MSDPLETLARRVQADPFFLASPLALFAGSEGMDDDALARFLRCPKEALTMLRLCRTPDEEPPGLQRDVRRIAERFGADEDALTEVVRRGQALRRLRESAAASGGTLLAARDPDPDEDDKP
jgi:hypothetical protein